MVKIKKAFLSDAEMIATHAKSIYKDHYLHLWNDGGADWYMNKYAYALEKIKSELEDINVEYYFLYDNDEIAGYLKLVLDAKFDEDDKGNAFEIERIYFYKKFTGKGFGKQVMAFAIGRATDLKKDLVFLKAMDTSVDAIKFYKHTGFNICGKFLLPMPTFSLMKPEYRGMVVLKKEV